MTTQIDHLALTAGLDLDNGLLKVVYQLSKFEFECSSRGANGLEL
jgi:hypothetical protein